MLRIPSGATSLYSRPSTLLPKIPTVDSVKKWQASFFYVKNENPAFNWVNLPEYSPNPPIGKLNWGHCAKLADPEVEVNILWQVLRDYVADERLVASDLLCCYISRRVLPLQARSHKICHMSGRFDPTRTSKLELSKAAVARRVNFVSQARLPDNWGWGMEPFNRAEPPPVVRFLLFILPNAGLRLLGRLILSVCCLQNFARQQAEDGDLALKVWTLDHVDPADQAGDDESPEAAEQGAQGQDDQPPSPQSDEGEQEVDMPLPQAPIRAVPLSVRAPAVSASMPKGRKRTTAQSIPETAG
jgi:hypothetical protein